MLYASIPLLISMLHAGSPAGAASELQLVAAGVVSHAEFEEGRWERVGGHLVGRGTGQVLLSKHRIATGSFEVSARLSIDELGATAAALMLGEDSYFGLDGVDGRPFVSGKIFGGKLRFVSSEPAPISARREFDLTIRREEDGPVRIEIDGQPCFEFAHAGTIGPFGFSPWLSTMRIASFSIQGRLESMPPLPNATEVFRADERYAAYRVPVLLSLEDGSLLAFAEARDGLAELAGNDIVLRRSTDGGLSFGERQLVAEDGENSLTNPCVVELPALHELLLMYQRYPVGLLPSQIEPELGPRSCRTFMSRSRDGGASWSAARDLTHSLKWREEVTTLATGPGHGIVLRRGKHAGRVLMPINQGPIGAWHVFAGYSDDAGESWELGAPAPVGRHARATEVQVVELADGRVLMNGRSVGGTHRRLSSISEDGGESWSRLTPIEELPDPPCSGSIVRYSDPTEEEPGLLLFANPATPYGRRLGTLFVSIDEGQSWKLSRRIQRGWFGYCSLARLPGERIGCLYEGDAGRVIRLARIEL